jgi:hypothetical protein
METLSVVHGEVLARLSLAGPGGPAGCQLGGGRQLGPVSQRGANPFAQGDTFGARLLPQSGKDRLVYTANIHVRHGTTLPDCNAKC